MEKDLALIEQFLDALWLEKNLAENTLSAYRRDLTMLVEWLAHRGLSLASAQRDDLQALLGERIAGGYKATSSARLLSAMRRLFQHLYREKIREDENCFAAALSDGGKYPQLVPIDEGSVIDLGGGERLFERIARLVSHEWNRTGELGRQVLGRVIPVDGDDAFCKRRALTAKQ